MLGGSYRHFVGTPFIQPSLASGNESTRILIMCSVCAGQMPACIPESVEVDDKRATRVKLCFCGEEPRSFALIAHV